MSLEQTGVIAGRVAVLSPEKIGLGLTVFASIETADHSADWLRRFAEGVSAMPEVMELYRMAGDVDYMLRVVVEDMAAYDAFYKRLIAVFPLKNVASRFAMERIKATTAPNTLAAPCWPGAGTTTSTGSSMRPESRCRMASSILREPQDEGFNGRMRDELLNEALFFDLTDARTKIAAWVLEFNTARPHSTLGYLTPATYAASFTATDDRLRNPDQLRRSPVAPTAPQSIKPAEALICRWMTSQ